ncbi:unnamed protein product [Phytomonas sp. EM1]|nr:unnamed protein product [Phytomonas sp. EM1]|eukprot:CCW64605.1 unnamed protein product [Phytomonas sp. isolate EM1]
MPPGKGIVAVKGSGRSKTRPEAFYSCQMQIGGTTLVLRTNVTVESSVTHSKSMQVLTCGQRIGHVATLVPNHKGIMAVIGGAALGSVATNQAALGNHSLSATLPSIMKLSSSAVEVVNSGEMAPAPDPNADRSKISDMTLPPQEASTYPLVEYYHIASRRWSAPGIARVEKWPTQSATAVLWDFSNPESNFSDTEKLETADEQQDLVELQSLNGDCNSTRSLLILPKIPTLVCAVGGWDGQRRFASMRLYAEETAKGSCEASTSVPGVSILPFPESIPPISGHSCTVVGGKLYVFGGTTLHGCSNTVHGLTIASSSPDWAQTCMNPGDPAGFDVAALTLVKEVAPVREIAIQGSSATSSEEKKTTERIPDPAPRSAHASCCLDDRILLFFGGRRLVLEDRPNPTKRHGLNNARSKTKSNSGRTYTRAGGAIPEEQPFGNFHLELFNDVIVYNTETRCWLPVQLTGGAAPCPRYGAAICSLPGLGREGEGSIKEILVHGGVDAAGKILSDAWILHSKKLSSGKETKIDMLALAAEAGRKTEPLQFVWVRLNLIPPPLTTVTPSSPQNQLALELGRAYHTAVVIAHHTRVREVLLVGGYVQGAVSAACMLRLSIPPIHKAEET